MLPDTSTYYFAAVVVCLLIKDNPIKALKCGLRGLVHTNVAGIGSGFGGRTGCGGWGSVKPPPPS